MGRKTAAVIITCLLVMQIVFNCTEAIQAAEITSNNVYLLKDELSMEMEQLDNGDVAITVNCAPFSQKDIGGQILVTYDQDAFFCTEEDVSVHMLFDDHYVYVPQRSGQVRFVYTNGGPDYFTNDTDSPIFSVVFHNQRLNRPTDFKLYCFNGGSEVWDNITDEQFLDMVHYEPVSAPSESPSESPAPDLAVVPESTDATHTVGSYDTVTIYCTGELKDFVQLFIDDELVDPSNYTLEDGSTILTLNSAFLDTLSPGEHKASLEFTTGVAETTIHILTREQDGASEKGDDNSDSKNEQSSAQDNETESDNDASNTDTGVQEKSGVGRTTAPRTGDDSSMLLLLLLAAAAVSVGTITYAGHKKSGEI